jgi:hypothetical protein
MRPVVFARTGVSAVLLACALSALSARAEDEGVVTEDPTLSGREIMRAVDERPEPQSLSARVVWRLLAPERRERKRETRVLRNNLDPERDEHRSKWLILVEAPESVRGVGLLVWSPTEPDADDDQWLYLPAYRKVRRIAGRDRDQAFLGSDFSFEDLTYRGLDEDEHVWLRDETIDGVDHAIVESTPLDSGSPYRRRVLWINRSSWTLRRAELYDREDTLAKTLDAKWELLDGYWVWKRLEMTTVESGHRTVLDFSRIDPREEIPDRVFTQSALRLGIR